MKNDNYLTARETATLLKISYHSALKLIRESGLPHVKVGRQYRVREAALYQYLIEEEKGGKR